MDGIEAFVDGGRQRKKGAGKCFLGFFRPGGGRRRGSGPPQTPGGKRSDHEPENLRARTDRPSGGARLGGSSPSEIDLVAVDTKSREYCRGWRKY